MRNTIGKLALAALGVSVVCAVAFAGSSGKRRRAAPLSPLSFLPSKKVRHFYEGTATLGPTVVRRSRASRLLVQGRRIGTRPTIGLHFDWMMTVSNVAKPLRFTMLTYERADAAGLRTLGMQFGNQPLEKRRTPYWDLKAPLKKGASWTFNSRYPMPTHYGIKGEVETIFVSMVRAVGRHYRLKGARLDDCIEIVELGTVRKMRLLTCSDGTPKAVRIKFLNTRLWCPGHLSVRDQAEHYLFDAKGRPAPCFPRYVSDNKLVRVKKLP